MSKQVRKKTKISTSMARQIELVEKYYPVDREKRVITLKLHYQTPEDILDLDIGDPMHPSFKTEILERVKDIIDTFPDGYMVDLQFLIDDYLDYDPNQLLDSFNDELEFNHYCSHKTSHSKWLKAFVLIFAGILLLFVDLYAKKNAWHGTGFEMDAFDLIYNTLATLFIWEAGTILFLAPSEYRVLGTKIVTRVQSVSFAIFATREIMAIEDRKKMIEGWVNQTKVDATGRFLILFSGSFLAVQSLGTLATTIQKVIDAVNNGTGADQGLVVNLVIESIMFSWYVIILIAGFGYFLEKGKLRKAVPVFAVLTILYNIFSLAVMIVILAVFGSMTTVKPSAIFATALSLVATSGYGIGYFLCLGSKRKEKKRQQQ